jgi:hypothetical protein
MTPNIEQIQLTLTAFLILMVAFTRLQININRIYTIKILTCYSYFLRVKTQ